MINDNNVVIATIDGVRTVDNDEDDVGDRIVCFWINPTTGQKYEFSSDCIDEEIDIKYVINELGIKEVPVYLDKNNQDNYFVDTEEVISRLVM